MKMIFGSVLLVLSVFLGVYVGFWLMFVGGIIQFVNVIQMHPIPGLGIAMAIVRILGATFAGFLSFGIILTTGLGLIKSSVNENYAHHS